MPDSREILVVEDDLAIRRLVKMVLEREGYRVQEAVALALIAQLSLGDRVPLIPVRDLGAHSIEDPCQTRLAAPPAVPLVDMGHTADHGAAAAGYVHGPQDAAQGSKPRATGIRTRIPARWTDMPKAYRISNAQPKRTTSLRRS